MRRLWHESNPALFVRIREELARAFPELRVSIESGIVVIRGALLIESEGELLDSYEIELWMPPDFPRSIPLVREIGGRIPHTAERHMNPNGIACVIVPEEWLLTAESSNLLRFLTGPVRDYFMGQSLVERGIPWPYGDRRHGRDGLLDAYSEMTGIADHTAVPRYLEYAAAKKPKAHWKCPCGSGKSVRDCHTKELRALRARVPRSIAVTALSRLRNPSLGT